MRWLPFALRNFEELELKLFELQLAAGLDYANVFSKLRRSRVKAKNLLVLPCLADYEDIRTSSTLEYIVSHTPLVDKGRMRDSRSLFDTYSDCTLF